MYNLPLIHILGLINLFLPPTNIPFSVGEELSNFTQLAALLC